MSAPSPARAESASRQPFWWRELAVPGVLVAFGTYLLYGVLTMEIPANVVFPGPRFFPLLILIGLYAFAAVLVVQALRQARTNQPPGAQQPALQPPGAPVNRYDPVGLDDVESQTAAGDSHGRQPIDWGSLSWAAGSFLAFALLLPYLGWVIAGGLVFCGVARAFGSTRVLFDLFVGLSVSSAAYIAFDMILGLSLPSGILGWGF